MTAKYCIAPSCHLRVLPRRVEAFPEGRAPAFLSLAQWRLVTEFSSPRDADEVYAESDAEISRDDLVALLDGWVASGILERDASGAPAAADERSLVDVLRRDVFGDPALVEQVGAQLRAGRLIVIPDAIDPALADEAWHALDRHPAWLPHEPVRQSPGHHYRHHNVQEPAPLALRTCMALFDSPRTKAFIEQLSGRPCGGAAALTAAWYQPGDYGMPHTDEAVDRTVSFIWHLTRDWDDAWGGQLVWCHSGASVFPRFNSLSIFCTSAHSMHFAAAVSSRARGKRLAINGWWHQPRSEAPGELAPPGSGAGPGPWPGPGMMDGHVVAAYGPPLARVGGAGGVIVV